MPLPSHTVSDLRCVRAIMLMSGASLIAMAAGPAWAQTTAPTPPAAAAPAAAETDAMADEFGDDAVEELVVTASSRPRGSVVGDIKPELVISPAEIRAYGVTSVTDLLDALAPQIGTSSNGGRPVVLINGARTSGFREIRDIPTEAISRIDILPEEVSLKYGYPADQRVINFVLRSRFRATTVEVGASAPTQPGGGAGGTLNANLLQIRRETRLQLGLKASKDQEILQSDRDVSGFTDNAFRTLRPEASSLALNGVLTRPLGNGVSGTLNGALEKTTSDSKIGLSPFSVEALDRRSQTQSASLGTVVNGAYAGWQWSYTGGAEQSESRSTTERAQGALAYTDRSKSTTTTATSDVVVNRSLFRLPAGQASATFAGRVEALRFDSDSLRAGVSRSTELERDTGELRASLDVPITRRGENIPAGVGSLSANFNLSAQNLSDFGALTTIGYGLNWTPIQPLRVLASFSQSDVAPTVNQLGDPVQATPGVRVFDLRRGVTADVVRLDGGNPALDAGERRVLKLGVTFKPFSERNLTFQANYTATHARDVASAFPSASTQVESAFPERFVRDASGALVQIDARPVNFARRDREELRYGFTFSKPLPRTGPPELGAMANADGTPNRELMQRMRQSRGGGQGRQGGGGEGQGAAPPGAGGPPGSGRPEGAPAEGGRPPGEFGGRGGGGGGGGFGGPRGGGGGFGGGGFGGGRGGRGGGAGVFQVGLYHTVAFKDEIQIRAGLPTLDLLEGAAIGQGGGSPRHQLDAQANYTKDGRGLAVNAKWESATRVNGQNGASDLNFSDLTTVNLRMFVDLGSQRFARGRPWLRGARATLSFNNIFDARQEVTTSTGTVPVSYQPDLLDPVGRSIKLTVRKLFL